MLKFILIAILYMFEHVVRHVGKDKKYFVRYSLETLLYHAAA